MKIFTNKFSIIVVFSSLLIMACTMILQAQTCTTKEFLYVNEPSTGTVYKFQITSNVALTEVIGANGGPHWYPGTGTSELGSPHGLATDLNGKLYIGESGQTGKLRRLNCDGGLEPVSATTITTQEGKTQNIFSIGNIIYHNSNGGPTAYNSCTGARIGKMCLAGVSNSTQWGLSYNPTTELVYASERNTGKVWVFTRGQLEAGIAGNPGTCIDPLIQIPGTSPKSNETFGIVGDDNGNFYVCQEDGNISKYNSSGTLVNQVNIATHVSFLIGITWSSSTNRLYVSNFNSNAGEDCISVIDASSMTYLGAGVPNPPNGGGNTGSKAIAILKESCPVNLPATFSRNVCGVIGKKFYLNQEAFGGCNGIVCGSSWTPVSTAGMTFDPCDNSVTIIGQGCGVFTLNTAAVSSSSCPAQSSTFTICNTFPPNIIVTTQPTCTPNGKYTLTGTLSVNEGFPPTGTLTISVPGGGSQTFNAPFASVINFNIPNIISYGGERTVYANFSDNNCSKTQPYIEPKDCPICTSPLAITLSQTAPTCTGITPDNNGKITLITADNTDKCGISTLNASTYDGPLYASATAYTTNKDVMTTIPNTGGTYFLRLYNTSNLCYKDTTITVVAVTCACTTPTAVTASSNSPVNEGSAINLTSTSTGGTSYSWSGPNGFTSTSQNPTIASATLVMAGTYTVMVSSSSGTCKSTATVVLIVTPTTIPPVDLALTKTVLSTDCKKQIGDNVVFKLLVRRQDLQTISVSGISVKDSLSTFLTFVSATASKGTYDNTTKLWSGITLAKGDSAILEITAKISAVGGFYGGLVCNEAWIQTMNGTDIDSEVGNKSETEDDFARACVSVPIKICQERDEIVIISAPAGYTSYQWYDDATGQPILGATLQNYSVTKAGKYSVRVNGNTCPNNSCCPIYVEDFCECKPNICVPFVVQKTKTRAK